MTVSGDGLDIMNRWAGVEKAKDGSLSKPMRNHMPICFITKAVLKVYSGSLTLITIFIEKSQSQTS